MAICLRRKAGVPQVIGHRGTTVGAPENTMAAFQHARDAGVDWVETDVKSTADGQLVLLHDRDR